MQAAENTITPSQYGALAEFRYQIRRFLRFSEEAARPVGIEPMQHQVLLAVMALPREAPPSIGELACRLLLRQHSTVGLVNRMERRGLVAREREGKDRRQVRVRITPEGEELLRKLTVCHQAELSTMGPALAQALAGVLRVAAGTGGNPGIGGQEGT